MAKKKAHVETDKEVIKKLDHDLEEELEHKAEEGGTGFAGAAAEAQEESVKTPQLEGHNKPKTDFDQPGTNNQSRVDIGAEEQQ